MSEEEAEIQSEMINITSMWLKNEINKTLSLIACAETEEEKREHLKTLLYLRNKTESEIKRIDSLIRRIEEENDESPDFLS